MASIDFEKKVLPQLLRSLTEGDCVLDLPEELILNLQSKKLFYYIKKFYIKKGTYQITFAPEVIDTSIS